MGISKPPADELGTLLAEKEQLELEELRYRLEDMRRQRLHREQQAKNREQARENLLNFQKETEKRQNQCNHRCGGNGMDAVNGQGTDSKYAVIKHRLPWGALMVLCMRCQKQWLPGDTGYEEAVGYPTDNKMSASSQFTFSRPVNPDVHQFRDEAKVA